MSRFEYQIMRNTINGQKYIKFGIENFNGNDLVPIIILKNLGRENISFNYICPITSADYSEPTDYSISFKELIEKFMRATNAYTKRYYCTDKNPIPELINRVLSKLESLLVDFCNTHMNLVETIKYLKHIKENGFEGVNIDNIISDYMIMEANHRFQNRKARIIQKRYRESITNPSYNLCKKRLIREWEEMRHEVI